MGAKGRLLACSHSHTEEHIMIASMDKWDISSKVHLALRDNGHNFIAGLRVSDFDCLAHTLQLVVNDGVLALRSTAV